MKEMRNYLLMGLGVAMSAAVMTACQEDDAPVVPEGPKIPAKVLYEEDFEGSDPFSTAFSKEVGDWDYALQYVNSPVYQGSVAARFEVRVDQPLIVDGIRSEVIIVKAVQGLITKNTWYSFAVYFPDSFVKDHTHDVISQWNEEGAPVRLLTDDDRFLLDVGNQKGYKEQIYIDQVTKNTWHEFVFHFIHSSGTDGLIDVWHNGVKRINRKGGNTYNVELPKWKIGIRKAAYENSTSDTQSRVVFFDNIKVTDENGSYEELDPGK